ncbi:translocation/assembly module TamB domain-containing protein [Undibacterium sp. CY18W]|uniref:Translocation/assembly module TamB domain-containing protein n=1 Tax=Undibacterium hunanense TaxID=2762292 RepID=A0ABR6ZYT5_9BURK|nr:translocation/assembly module TamB domain-containing protein [Undibacterium hunanense]MBC3921043.1 translocation/assembly module TamB domain-containing protein [Undibacterium hunanense]
MTTPEAKTTVAKTKKNRSVLARLLLVTCLFLLLLAVTLTILLTWASKTESGTRSLLAVTEKISGGSLQFEGIKGAVGDDLAIDKFSYKSKTLVIEANAVSLQWRPAALWRQQVDIPRLQASSLRIASLPGKDPAKLPTDLSLPFTLDAHKLALGHLHIATLSEDGKQRETLVLSALSGSLHFQDRQYRLVAGVTSPWGRAEMQSSLASLRPYKLNGQFSLQGQVQQDIPALALKGSVAGSLQELQLALQAQAAEQNQQNAQLQGQAQASLTPFDAPYLRELNLDIQHFNPAAWQAAAPQADLRLLARLKPVGDKNASRFVLAGDVSASNAQAAAINKQGLPVQSLTARLQLEADRLALQGLAVQLNGNGKLQGDARLSWVNAELAADVQLSLSNVDLAQIDQRLHASQIKGKLSAQTDKDKIIHLQAQLTDTKASLKADGTYHGVTQLFSLDKFDLQAEDAHLQGSGDIAFSGKQAFKLKANLSNFDPARWIATPAGNLQAAISLQGEISPRLNLQISVPQLQGQYAGQVVQSSLDLQWLQDQQVRVRQLDLHWGKNTLTGQGNWGAADDVLKLNLDAPELNHFNPLLSNWQLALNGALKADISLRGKFAEPAGSLDAQAQQLRIKYGSREWTIAQLKSRLNLDNGSKGNFDGDIVASHIGGDLPDFSVSPVATNATQASAPASASVPTPVPTPTPAQVKAQAAADKISELHLQLKGRRDAHTIALESTFPNRQTFGLGANGSMQADAKNAQGWSWNGQLQALSLNGKPDVKMQGSAPLQLSSQSVRLGALSLHSELGSLVLEELEWTPAALKTKGRITDVRVIDIANLVRPQYAVTGNLKLNAQWDLQLRDHAQGEIKIQRQSGDLRFNDPDGTGNSVALGIRDLQLQMRLGGLVAGTDGEDLALTMNAEGARLGSWKVKANTLLSKQDGAWTIAPSAALNGQATAAIPDLQWLGPWINPGLVLKGKLNVDARLMGTVGKPAYRADLAGRELEVAFAAEGLLLPNGSLDAQIEDTHLKVSNLQFSNTITSVPRHALLQGMELVGQKGEFKASGDIDMGKETGSIRAQWQHFPLLQRKDRWLVVSGKADIVEANNIWSLTGKVDTDGAYFKLPKMPPPSLSSDVVVTRKSDKLAVKSNDSEAPKKGLKTRVDVSFDMGPRFVFVGRGLDTGLEGSLRLRSIDGSPLQATGSISTVRGAYEGYGQQLAIERGILNFQGPPANPGLNIRALRRGLAVEAGVEIVGTVAAPQVRLVSEPAVPDAEKLSWLVLGRGADQLAGSDASLLMSAASAIFGGDGSRNVPRDIVQGLGFDEFSIGSSSANNTTRLPGQTVAGSTGNTTTSTDQVVSVGKRLMPGLVLSIERGLADASGGIKLSWQLTRRVSIIGRTGTESAVDVNYTFSFN